MNEYKVGQILFLIGSTNSVVPIQVIEEVIRTTLKGKEKTYIVKLPDKKETTVDIKKIKGELFTSKKSVVDFMIDNAKNAIKEMVLNAEEIAASAFELGEFIEAEKSQDVVDNQKDLNLDYYEEDNPYILQDNENVEKVQQEKQNDIIKIDLGNGKFGKISSSDLEKAGGLDWKYYC